MVFLQMAMILVIWLYGAVSELSILRLVGVGFAAQERPIVSLITQRLLRVRPLHSCVYRQPIDQMIGSSFLHGSEMQLRGKSVRSWCDRSSDRSFMIDPLSYFTFQPVLHDWCNKGRGMCYPVCGMVHIKELLLLIRKSIPCGGSGFLL